MPTEPRPTIPPTPGFALDDVFYTLFRHKRLIVGSAIFGLIAAGIAYLFVPITYVSRAKLLIKYVVQGTEANSNDPSQIVKSVSGGDNILNSELEILKSLDVARPVAESLGPARVLAKLGGGTNLMRAAGEIRARVSVEVPKRTDVIVVSFEHPDRNLVQPALTRLIESYQEKHRDVRLGKDQDEIYEQQAKQIRGELAETTRKLNDKMAKAHIVNLEEAIRLNSAQVTKVSDELFAAQTELAERKAVRDTLLSNQVSNDVSNPAPTLVAQEVSDEYAELATRLDEAKKRKRQLLAKGFRDEHPEVSGLVATISELERQKLNLEEKHPSLAMLERIKPEGGIRPGGVDSGAELMSLKRITARVNALSEQLSNIQAKAYGVLSVEPEIGELLRQRDSEEASLRSVMAGLEARRMNEVKNSGRVPSMGDVQSPSPPAPESQKRTKLVLGAFGGCLGFGLALAFLIDFLLDQTIRRSVDVERQLHLPLLLAIPHTFWKGGLRLPWQENSAVMKSKRSNHHDGTGAFQQAETGLAAWSPGNQLQVYAEGLRERLITYFEINHLSQAKPKRVAVTSCSKGAGVTTIASSLAAALSRGDDTKVLFVDMNVGQGVAHTFRNGYPEGRYASTESQDEAESSASGCVSIVPGHNNSDVRADAPLPNPFTGLAPQFEANDHDYVIFDLPPVTQTSISPRLSGYMDLVLLILESEKTGRQVAVRASTLMRESRANVSAVLNKCRRHVPLGLSQEL